MTWQLTEFSGHVYYGTNMSAYESTNTCGTCDGARCHKCRRIIYTMDWETDKILNMEEGDYVCPEAHERYERYGY